MKANGCLGDTFTDTHLIKHNRVFNPCAVRTLVNIYHGAKQEGKMSDQQIMGVSTSTNKTDVGQEHDIVYEVPKT